MDKHNIKLLTTSSFQRTLAATTFQRSSMKKLGLWNLDGFDMKGKRVFVTGATDGGIGFESAKSFCKYGAEVVVALRSDAAAEVAVNKIKAEVPSAVISSVKLDLSSKESIYACIEIMQNSNQAPFDIVLLNAGVVPTKYSTTKEGIETGFATNTLGNFILSKLLIENKLVTDRIVVVTGDIYIMARKADCDPYYKFTGLGDQSYSKSKLGLNWITMELQKRYKEFENTENTDIKFILLHPGVIHTNLFKGFDWFKNLFFIDTFQGSRLNVFCCCEETEKVANISEGYYHNTFGLVKFQKGDLIMNEKRAKEIYDFCLLNSNL